MTETDSQIQLKVEIRHDVRNKDASVSDIEKQVKLDLNHVEERITDIRISVGHKASAVFLTLKRKRWSHKNMEKLVRKLPQSLEYFQYAENMTVGEWFVETSE